MPAPGGSANERHLTLEVASRDPLSVRHFDVTDAVGGLFEVKLVAMTDNAGLDFDAIVGGPARFTLAWPSGSRGYSGLISQMHQVGVEEGGLSTYELTLVPTLWLLTQRRNHRMFQQMSEPEIVLALLAEWGIAVDPFIDLEAYKKRKYKVQYGESDHAFCARLLEDAGIAWFFSDEGGETKLVLSDAPQGAPPRDPALAFVESPNPGAAPLAFATEVRLGRRVRPGKYTMRDRDFRLPPSYPLLASAAASAGNVEDRLERFHYTPGAFLFRSDKGDPTPSADDKGKTRTSEPDAAVLAQKRLDAKRVRAKTVTFVTNAYDLSPGSVTPIVGHPHPMLGKPLLVVRSLISGSSYGEWSCSCEAVTTDVPFRPELATPKPKVSGLESATVVGPTGEEIHTDEMGRVRVHFHWDRESKMDDNSSSWIPVSQPWGGAGYGGLSLPRIGQEVLVDFLGGDPDRPIIVGRVFTNLQKVPYGLPANKTRSGWKSNSTDGTGGYNELMFEDAAGRELLNIQAERDLNKLVKNDETVTIGRDRTKNVGNDDALAVGNNRTKTVGGNERVSIGVNRSMVVGLNRNTQIGAVDSTVVGEVHTVQVMRPSEGGGGDCTHITCTTGSVTVQIPSGPTITLSPPQQLSGMPGDVSPANIKLDSGGGATIKLEGSMIAMDANAIFINAKSTMYAVSTGDATIAGKSKMTVSSSGGDVVIQGGPKVKINPA